MCGVSGIMSLGGGRVAVNDIKRMVNVLSHRGPDDEGIFHNDTIGLGHRRLSIFDLSSGGHQPMWSRCKRYVIVHNGEIYNWPEIRKALKFSDWRTKTDTETVLESFVEQGQDCLALFNGIYAFAIWDVKEQRLFLARDRVGVKPLLYGIHQDMFYFASEIKSILAAGFPKKCNNSMVYDFLRWGSIDHCSETFFEGVLSCPPGHSMSVSVSKGLNLQSYWNIEQIVNLSPSIGRSEAVEQYEELLKQSVVFQSRSDVPVAAFLSGGVDSSILVSQLADIGISNLTAFTYDFDTGGSGESEEAGIVAKVLGIDHETLIFRHSDVATNFERVLFHQETPFTSMRVLAAHKLYELCKSRGFTVIIEGQGGDQLGAGFEYYWMAVVMDVLREKGSGPALELTGAFLDHFKVPRDKREERQIQALGAIVAQGTATQDGRPFVRPELLGHDFLNENSLRSHPIQNIFESHLLNAQYNDFTGGNLQRVLRYADRASMSVGCEARVPILDHNIVELCFCSVSDARVNNTEQRHLMREAAKNLLPSEILNSPKRSVVDPQRSWLKNELRSWVQDVLNSDVFKSLEFFDVKAVHKEYQTYCDWDGVPPSGFHIFQYINTALWYEKIIKGDLLEN